MRRDCLEDVAVLSIIIWSNATRLNLEKSALTGFSIQLLHKDLLHGLFAVRAKDRVLTSMSQRVSLGEQLANEGDLARGVVLFFCNDFSGHSEWSAIVTIFESGHLFIRRLLSEWDGRRIWRRPHLLRLLCATHVLLLRNGFWITP